MTTLTIETDTVDPSQLVHSLEDFHTVYAPAVSKISRKVSNEFKTVDAEELEGMLWVDIAGTWQNIIEATGKFTVPGILRRRAIQHANKERIDYMHFSGSYLYTPKDVRKILSESAWSDVEQAPDIEGRVDVRRWFDTLAPGRKAAVYKRYGLGFSYKELTKSEQNALERGVTDITDRLNNSLHFYSVSFESSLKEYYGAGHERADHIIAKKRQAHEASNFLNGKD